MPDVLSSASTVRVQQFSIVFAVHSSRTVYSVESSVAALTMLTGSDPTS